MVTQYYSKDKIEIKVEIAENLKDAEINKFDPGQFSRYIVDGKVVNYMDMIQKIIKTSEETGKSLVPDEKELKKLQKTMMDNSKNEIIKSLEDMRNLYKNQGCSEDIIKELDRKIASINLNGVRDRE